MVQYKIRQLTTPEEFAVCAQMMLSASPWNVLYFTREQCKADLANDALQVHAAVAPDGEIFGFMASMAHGIGFEPMIEYLCIGQKHRGLGIGSALIAFFEEKLFPEADNLYLFVSDINPDAMRLYVRLGYQQVGALPNFNLEKQTEFLHRKSRRPRQAARAAAFLTR